jgi:hypothetical protein
MRKSVIAGLMAAILLAASCCNDRCETGYEVPAPEDVMMYQVNPRVFAPEKSFNAVAQHLDSIKALGIAGKHASIFATHPSLEDRIEALERLQRGI